MDDLLHEKARESIIDLMAKTGRPLTPSQGVTLAGAIKLWQKVPNGHS